ncbi:paREP5 [Pyrobaculum oguniense TE7]|uniref:PaREP5 n=1 Tax=Pyrobaculum oguniense (strain DSM 13380 / JCM 10595 / TE7) TaxID=698757 RepID=H6QA88_PYROT|nr:paREP5 [Pyrobaculum oguniense TE7]
MDKRLAEERAYVEGRFEDLKRYVDKLFADMKSYVDGRLGEERRYVDGRFADMESHVDGKFAELRAYVDRRLDRLLAGYSSYQEFFMEYLTAEGLIERGKAELLKGGG